MQYIGYVCQMHVYQNIISCFRQLLSKNDTIKALHVY